MQPALSANTSRRYWLLTAVFFALALVVVRACVQSITIDEADTYLDWVTGAAPRYWAAKANNHLLNSMLMRFFVSVFGLHHITVRAPAIVGAGVYLWICYLFVRRLTCRGSKQVITFVCLSLNPFVLDHLVAARGYSLAMGLFAGALYAALLSVWELRTSGVTLRDIERHCVLCSVCAGLSICANFSFAIVNASLLLVLVFRTWHARRRDISGLGHRILARVRLTAVCIAPGLAMFLFLAGPLLLLPWDKDQFIFGAKSLRETLLSVYNSSLFEPSTAIVGPAFYPFVLQAGGYILMAAGALFAYRLLMFGLGYRQRVQYAKWDGIEIPAFVGSVIVLSLGTHRLLYRLFHTLMPLNRTAVYLAPLITLLAVAILFAPASGILDRYFRRLATPALGLVALYFLICLRIGYFREWRFNAHTQDAYAVVADLNRRYAFDDLSSSWRYVAVLNFYRVLYDNRTLHFVPPGPPHNQFPADKQVYALWLPEDWRFVAAQSLKVVYEDDTGMAIAIRPGLESKSRQTTCVQ